MKGISVMKKVIVFLVISLSISLILTSCNSEDDNVYETSVGIIDNTGEIKDIHTYQLAWIDSGIVDGLSDDEWSSFIAECRYCFIPTSDYSWVKSFAKEKNIPCYNFNQSELLLGVILDTSDIAVLIPVDVTYMNGDHPNDISLEPDEYMLLKLYAAIRISNDAYADTCSFIRNNQSPWTGVNIENAIRIFDRFTCIIRTEPEEVGTSEDIIAVCHCRLTKDASENQSNCSIIANTEIAPGEGISVKCYSSTFKFSKALMLENERYTIENTETNNKNPYDRMHQKGNGQLSVSYYSTWKNQEFKQDEKENSFTWNVSITNKKENTAYCHAAESFIKADGEDPLLELRLDNVELTGF